jgi:tRNA (cytidine/uridine-2'-O-)-methyltransferase
MLHVVLVNPEIPANTGNIIRLCANTNTALHLIHPLGFVLEDARLRRAGLDYHEYARVSEHRSLDEFVATAGPRRLLACSTRGTTRYDEIDYAEGDALLFGPETRGLASDLLAGLPREHILRIPMTAHSRSLNLSNAVAVVVYEAWRQQGFAFTSR